MTGAALAAEMREAFAQMGRNELSELAQFGIAPVLIDTSK